ncbi:MAG: tetratricopeptide repeat protein [Casimicrobiaceae bacterium]
MSDCAPGIASADARAVDAAANAAFARGDYALAEAHIRDAIGRFGARPGRMAMLGWSLIRLGRAQDAVSALQPFAASIAGTPLLAPLGIGLLLSGDAAAACAVLGDATAQFPLEPEAWNALGLAHVALAHPAEAENALRRALAVSPRFVPALANLCDLLVQESRSVEAIEIAAQATREHPQHAAAWFKLGQLQMLALDTAAARAALLRCRELEPRHAPTHRNLALVDEWSGDLDAAQTGFRTALALAGDDADARFGLATVLLKQRQGDEAWPLYAQGAAGVEDPSQRIGVPAWDGGTLGHGALLVDPDQGLGDVLQFARFLPLARARVPRLLLFCDGYFASLKSLLASLPGIEVVDRDAGAHAVAATCRISELPNLLGLGNSAFAPLDAYLAPPADAMRHWAARVAPLRGLKVGICWSGNARRADSDARRVDARRSLTAARFVALLDVPSVTFVALQKDMAAEDAAALGGTVVDWTHDLTDYAQTAALIAHLDLVICVDTSIVHCAGAIGTPVWMLDRFENCWRWGSDPAQPGWYRNLRVFRQPSFGDWDGALRALRMALVERAAR